MRRSGVCTGKDTGIKQTEREIAAWLLVIKNKPGYGQKKEGGYAQNERKKPSCGRCKKHLTKPSAFESEIHPSHKLRLCSVYFALPGANIASKYPRFFKINNELEQQNNAIYKKEKQRATKKKELSEIKGWFKGRKKKELQEEIDDLTSQIRNMKDYLPKIVQKVGYRSVQEFLKDFKTAKSEYNQYQKAIAQWQQETGKEPEPQPHGVRAKLAANRKKIEQEQKNTQRTQNQSKDRGAR